MRGASSVFKVFGKELKIYKEGKLKTNLYYPTTLKTDYNFKIVRGSTLAELKKSTKNIDKTYKTNAIEK